MLCFCFVITTKIDIMANTHDLFQEFNSQLHITQTKKDRLIKSRDNLRGKIESYFRDNHPRYHPSFWIQGSYKMNTMIRTKDDTCDLDDGVRFDGNPDKVSCTTLQSWVKQAVEGTTDSISHRKKCITVDYKADYNIDLPVYVYNKNEDSHPLLAVKDGDWREDDPEEMVDAFNTAKDENGQLLRLVRYLKAWANNKGDNMPSGLALTILAMSNFTTNNRDDVALKFTLIEIEKALKIRFVCIVPATPNDNIFAEYSASRQDNFMNKLSAFIEDAKKAVDEKNYKKASELWRKHLGDRFPIGKDEDEKAASAATITPIIGRSKPYYDEKL